MSFDDTPPPEHTTLRRPPHSMEAEQAVLGALLVENDAWDRIGDLLKPEDFYKFEHRTIFGVLGEMINATKMADTITVGERLAKQGKLDEVGGLRYLNAIQASTPTVAGIRSYAKIVRENSVRRQIIAMCDEAATAAFGEDDPASVLDALQMRGTNLEAGRDEAKPRLIEEVLIERLDRMTSIHEGSEEDEVIATPFPTLNTDLQGGLRAGKTYVLAARPGGAKSAIAELIGIHAAMNEEAPTLFLSQEMPEEELADRAIAQQSKVDYGNIQRGKLDDIDWSPVSDAISRLRIPFYVDATPGLTLGDMRRKARQVPGLKLLILDYLQLSEVAGSKLDNRSAAIGSISRGLKSLAKELKCAVIVLSQLSRKCEDRTNKIPIMADLRDSGEIEADADVIIFLSPIRTLYGGKCHEIAATIGKNRNGLKIGFGINFWGGNMTAAESAKKLSELFDNKGSNPVDPDPPFGG